MHAGVTRTPRPRASPAPQTLCWSCGNVCKIHTSAPTSVRLQSQRGCLMLTSSRSLPLISEFLPSLCTPGAWLSRRAPFMPQLPRAPAQGPQKEI